LQLSPGDSLVIFTDGLSEAEGVEQQEKALAALKEKVATLHGVEAEEVVQAIEDLVLSDVDTPVTDDVTLVVVNRNVPLQKAEENRLDRLSGN